MPKNKRKSNTLISQRSPAQNPRYTITASSEESSEEVAAEAAAGAAEAVGDGAAVGAPERTAGSATRAARGAAGRATGRTAKGDALRTTGGAAGRTARGVAGRTAVEAAKEAVDPAPSIQITAITEFLQAWATIVIGLGLHLSRCNLTNYSKSPVIIPSFSSTLCCFSLLCGISHLKVFPSKYFHRPVMIIADGILGVLCGLLVMDVFMYYVWLPANILLYEIIFYLAECIRTDYYYLSSAIRLRRWLKNEAFEQIRFIVTLFCSLLTFIRIRIIHDLTTLFPTQASELPDLHNQSMSILSLKHEYHDELSDFMEFARAITSRKPSTGPFLLTRRLHDLVELYESRLP